MSQHKNNPYAKAAGTYDNHAQAHTGDQRELEARVLQKSNRMIQSLIDGWEQRPPELLEETLKYNRQIWMLFYDTAIENKDGGRPNDLRSNIVNLANFIFKRELEILSKPEKKKLEILMSINHEISEGLLTGIKNSQNEREPQKPVPPQQSGSTDIIG